MDRKLIIFEHNKVNKNVYIGFANFKDNQIVSQEEGIFEEKEIYEIFRERLVKFFHNNKKVIICKAKK